MISDFFSGCNSTYRLRYWNLLICYLLIGKQSGCNSTYRLRYWNPKLCWVNKKPFIVVATVLTVYGIETPWVSWKNCNILQSLQQYLPFTVLKLQQLFCRNYATLLLQQYLPFTVLKPLWTSVFPNDITHSLQQYLPFTVLKLRLGAGLIAGISIVATVLTVYGIETSIDIHTYHHISIKRCNSTYRLRYWNQPLLLFLSA